MYPIKAARITHLTDARYFAVFAEWVGFNFDLATPPSLTPDAARELAGWISGVRLIGEFGNSPIEYINQVVNALKLDTVEINDNVDITGISPLVSSIIRRIFVNENTNLATIEQYLSEKSAYTAAFVLDFSADNHTWQSLKEQAIYRQGILQEWCKKYPIIIAISFDEQNIVETISNLQPLAVELHGSNEHIIGIKTFDELNAIVEKLDEY